jgi:hypothetical protein
MSLELEIAIIGLVGVVIGGGITALTTWAIAREERNKHKRERIWDLRRDAYMKIVASMVQAARLMEHINENYQSDPHGYDASEDTKQALSEFIESFKDARAVYTSNALLISKLFSEKFENIHDDISIIRANDNLIPPESSNKAWLAIDKGCGELLSIAKAEVLGR